MKTISIANLRRTMLPPMHVPELGLLEHRIGTNERDKRTGVVGRRKLVRQLPQTITLCAKGTPGDRVDRLPEGAARAVDVVAALRRGDIRLTVVEHAAEAQPATASPVISVSDGVSMGSVPEPGPTSTKPPTPKVPAAPPAAKD